MIYKVTEELRAAMEGMLEPEEVEEALGQAEVLELFKASRVGTIAGCAVTDGSVTRGAEVRLVRDGTVVWTGRIGSLRRFKDDVREVEAGLECGIVLEGFQDVKVGDVLEVFETQAGREDARVAAARDGRDAPYVSPASRSDLAPAADSQDLKEKRKVVSSLKAQVRQRFGAAVAEIDGQDDRRRATLLCALVGGPRSRERRTSWSASSRRAVRTGAGSSATCCTLADIRG